MAAALLLAKTASRMPGAGRAISWQLLTRLRKRYYLARALSRSQCALRAGSHTFGRIEGIFTGEPRQRLSRAFSRRRLDTQPLPGIRNSGTAPSYGKAGMGCTPNPHPKLDCDRPFGRLPACAPVGRFRRQLK